MSVFVALDTALTINAVDLSDHVTQAGLSTSTADVPTTAFGDLNVTRIGGLKDGSLTVTFQQDFAASSTWHSLEALESTVTTATLKKSSGATAADNPLATFDILLTENSILDAAVGDLAEFSVTWPVTGPVVYTTS
jgi:hypothetical protein